MGITIRASTQYYACCFGENWTNQSFSVLIVFMDRNVTSNVYSKDSNNFRINKSMPCVFLKNESDPKLTGNLSDSMCRPSVRTVRFGQQNFFLHPVPTITSASPSAHNQWQAIPSSWSSRVSLSSSSARDVCDLTGAFSIVTWKYSMANTAMHRKVCMY